MIHPIWGHPGEAWRFIGQRGPGNEDAPAMKSGIFKNSKWRMKRVERTRRSKRQNLRVNQKPVGENLEIY